MNDQMALPFREFDIPEAHIRWMMLANAGEYSGKKSQFYPFKNRFLYAHGVPDGWDLQVIKRHCYACEGTGVYDNHGYGYRVPCNRCTDGVYDISKIQLRRWILGGHLFHEPLPFHTLRGEPRETIHGYIRHTLDVPHSHAERAFKRLLLRYEPLTLWQIETSALKCWGRHINWKVQSRFRRVWALLNASFGKQSQPADDDIPF